MAIKCPQCSAVLRSIDGLHQPGEPYMQFDEQGSFMICLGCDTRVNWRDEDDRDDDADFRGAVPA